MKLHVYSYAYSKAFLSRFFYYTLLRKVFEWQMRNIVKIKQSHEVTKLLLWVSLGGCARDITFDWQGISKIIENIK